MLDLGAQSVVYCRRCDNVCHNDCTEGAERQPFQLREDRFCDNAGEPTACPTCSVEGAEDAKYVQAEVSSRGLLLDLLA